MAAPKYQEPEPYEPPAPYEFESQLENPLVQLLLEKLEGKLSPEEEYRLKEDVTNLQRGIATRAGRTGTLPTGATQRELTFAGMELPMRTRQMEQQKQQVAIGETLNMLGFQGAQQQFGYGQAQQAGQFGYEQAQQAGQFGFDKMWANYWNRKAREWQLEDIEAQRPEWYEGLGSIVGGGIGALVGSAAGPMGTLAGWQIGSGVGGGASGMFSKRQMPQLYYTGQPEMYPGYTPRTAGTTHTRR